MSVSLLCRALPLPRPRLAPLARAVQSGPPETPVGPLASAVGLGVFFLAVLGPPAWIMSHLQSYKTRE